MKPGDLVRYNAVDFPDASGVGLIIRTNTMYAFVKWSGYPSAQPFIADKKHLEMVSESR